MPYVMMPVPEEHVEEVMQFILRAISRASLQSWDDESITAVFDELDEAGRSVLAFVARASLEGIELSDVETARKIQLNPREVAGIMNELNALGRDSNRPPLLSMRTATERLPNGRLADRRLLQMDPEVAELVRAAELSELRSAPHPSGTEAG